MAAPSSSSSSTKPGGGDEREKKKKMDWMYEGPKSSLSREDYLLGKKIDKNFTIVSDVLIRDQGEEKHAEFFKQGPMLKAAVSSGGANSNKTSALGLETIRSMDPLVSIKMREEERRRALLENPLLKAKAQRLLKKAFEKEQQRKAEKSAAKKAAKKEKHGEKGEKKRKRKRDDSESSSSAASSDTTRSRSPSPERRGKHQKSHSLSPRRRSPGRRNFSGEEKSRRAKRGKSRSPSRSPSPRESRRKDSHHHRHERQEEIEAQKRRRGHSGSRSASPQERRRHHHHHNRRSPSKTSSKSSKSPSPPRRQAPAPRQPISTTSSTVSREQKPLQPSRQKLSAEEMERRRREMMANANWRDEVREETVRDAAEKLRREEEEAQKHANKGASFIKPMLESAHADLSVEKRLQSRRQNLQRSTDYMDKSFARRN